VIGIRHLRNGVCYQRCTVLGRLAASWIILALRAVTKAPNDGAVPVVVVEVEFLSFEHWLAASDAGCAVCLGE
jgi:hypothetical protein